MERVTCPHCRSSINGKADVCRYCARDVRRLLAAQVRIRALKANRVAPSPPHAAEVSLYSALLVAFYIITTVVLWYSLPPAAEDDGFNTNVLLLAIYLITAASLCLATRACNAAHFFSLGFAQPVLSFLVLLLLGSLTLDETAKAAPDLFRDAVSVGGLLALGGVVTAYASKILPIPAVALTWHSVSGAQLERWQKVALRMAAVAAPLISLISLFKKGG